MQRKQDSILLRNVKIKHMGTTGPHIVQQLRFCHHIQAEIHSLLNSIWECSVLENYKQHSSDWMMEQRQKCRRCFTFIKDRWGDLFKETECRRSSYSERNSCSTLWWMGQQWRHVKHASRQRFMINSCQFEQTNAFLVSLKFNLYICSAATWEKRKKKHILLVRNPKTTRETKLWWE